MCNRSFAAAVAVALTGMMPSHGLAAELLKIASPIRGSWEGAIPELGKQAGIFQKHGLDLDILYTQGGGETMQVVVSGSVDVGFGAGRLGERRLERRHARQPRGLWQGCTHPYHRRQLDRVARNLLVGCRQIAVA